MDRSSTAAADRSSAIANQDVEALLLGFLTVRITWPRMTFTPAAEAGRPHAILSRRREELRL